MKPQRIHNGDELQNIAFSGKEIIVQKMGNGSKIAIIINGHSLSAEKNGDIYTITRCDPGMHWFYPVINRYTVYVVYFTFECKGLKEAGLELAQFINSLNECPITLIGHSKGALCIQSACSELTKQVNVITVSAPFAGTPVVDKDYVENKLQKFRVFGKFLYLLYQKIFSNHAVDQDLKEGSTFLKNLQPFQNVEKLVVITTELTLESCHNITDIFLLLWQKILGFEGDGIVPLDSQNAVPNNYYVKYPSGYSHNNFRAVLKQLEEYNLL